MTFTCCICEKEQWSLPIFGPVDSCVECCADADGVDLEDLKLETQDQAHYRLWPRRHI